MIVDEYPTKLVLRDSPDALIETDLDAAVSVRQSRLFWFGGFLAFVCVVLELQIISAGAYEEEGRAVNTMKAAISTADRVVTVSPGYAYEIQTELGGWGMEFLLGGRQYALNGILNGIDDVEWSPTLDKHLPHPYSLADISGKAKCKEAMQRELGLPIRADVPLIAFIGRLDYQKGADQLLAAAPWMMQQGVQLVCLGTGM